VVKGFMHSEPIKINSKTTSDPAPIIIYTDESCKGKGELKAAGLGITFIYDISKALSGSNDFLSNARA